MVLGTLFRSTAVAATQPLARRHGYEDNHLHFLSKHALPVLDTLKAAPDQINSDNMHVSHSDEHNKLRVRFSAGQEFTFIFREEDIIVLSSEPFSTESFLLLLHTSLR